MEHKLHTNLLFDELFNNFRMTSIKIENFHPSTLSMIDIGSFAIRMGLPPNLVLLREEIQALLQEAFWAKSERRRIEGLEGWRVGGTQQWRSENRIENLSDGDLNEKTNHHQPKTF
jgi:hypothetical protein